MHGPVGALAHDIAHADRRCETGCPRIVPRQSDAGGSGVDQHVDRITVDSDIGIEMAIWIAVEGDASVRIAELGRVARFELSEAVSVALRRRRYRHRWLRSAPARRTRRNLCDERRDESGHDNEGDQSAHCRRIDQPR
jgi:hypothetical protein